MEMNKFGKKAMNALVYFSFLHVLLEWCFND